MTPSVTERLGHINAAIADVSEALEGQSRESFTDSLVLRMAIERLFEIMSEASRHLPEDMKRYAPGINWRRLADLGNWLRHAYHRTDALLLWEMVQNDLPPLKSFAEQALEKAKHTL